jgi:hypothetical protein
MKLIDKINLRSVVCLSFCLSLRNAALLAKAAIINDEMEGLVMERFEREGLKEFAFSLT